MRTPFIPLYLKLLGKQLTEDATKGAERTELHSFRQLKFEC